MLISSARTRFITAVAVVALTALALTGCSGSLVSQRQHWDTAAAMQSSGEGDLVPTLVNDDATDIDLDVDQVGSGTAIRWTSPSGITRTDCGAGPIRPARSTASWWPADPPESGWTCGWWTVFASGGKLYAGKHVAESTTD